MPPKLNARFIGVELYFDHLDEGKRFYGETLGFDIRDEVPGHFTRFVTEPAFICLERKGMEPYPWRDKAVIFLAVPNLVEAVNAVAKERIVEMKPQGESARHPGLCSTIPKAITSSLLRQRPRDATS